MFDISLLYELKKGNRESHALQTSNRLAENVLYKLALLIFEYF